MKKLLYIFTFLLISICGFSEETLKEKIQNILNDKTISDPFKRWQIADDTIFKYQYLVPYEEAMPILQEILLPFIEKKVKNVNQRNHAKAFTYKSIHLLYYNAGNPTDLVEKTYLKKGLECAELSANSLVQAILYRSYGYFQSTTGSIQIAHEYYYKAIHFFESLNMYNDVFDCLYLIAENLLQARDFAGLRKVIEQMKYNLEKAPSDGNFFLLYNFYAVQSAYYCILFEDFPENMAFKDSGLLAGRNSIHVIENNLEEILKIKDCIGYDYYNMAILYRERYPNRFDSIYYYLDKALDFKTNEQITNLELKICVYQLYAELHFAQKNYKEAERDIFHVLSLLEQVKDHNSVIVDYSEAYKFLVLFYETLNRPMEALKYHKLLLENEKKRYENDKIVAMSDMLVKYEVEKKEEQIDRLEEQNKTARKILILTITLIAVLFIVLFILIHLHKLRKKNLEQSVYEQALLAELKQTELERIKQQLEQKPTKAVIGKLTELISNSVMQKMKKNIYIQQITELDIDMLEQGYLTADEKISNMDMKYIICFAINMDVADMSLLFNVEPASIYTVRYRIKKKFGKKNTFQFLM